MERLLKNIDLHAIECLQKSKRQVQIVAHNIVLKNTHLGNIVMEMCPLDRKGVTGMHFLAKESQQMSRKNF